MPRGSRARGPSTVRRSPPACSGSAAKKSYDPVVDIDWAAPIPEGLYGLSPRVVDAVRHAAVGRMTEEQRVTLTIHEYCSISGVGIWFECCSCSWCSRDIYGEDPAQPHVQWALTEIADECRHSVMFARTAETFGAPSYQPARRDPAAGHGVREARSTGRPRTPRSSSPRRSSTSSSAT